MIKNLVFDCGQVLYKFEPSFFVSKYEKNENDAKILEEVIFSRKYWDKLDDGTISDEEVKAEFKKELPEHLHKKSEIIYDNWIEDMPVIEGMEEMISEMKSRFGAKIFLLSNISKGFAKKAPKMSFYKYFDDCIYSAVCKLTKPHREIFEYLCNKNGLKPEETIFIDDKKRNTDAGEEYGIKGYVFDGDVPKLRKYLIDAFEKGE